MSAGRLTNAWRQSLAALAMLLVWNLFLYRDTVMAMVTIWSRSETFTHAFLVLPIVLWLVWRERQRIVLQTPWPSPGILFAISASAFAWLLGDLAAVNSVSQLALVSLLVLAVPAVLGLPVARLVVFPLAFLYFAVPIGEFFMPQLMDWTADFTVLALRLSGIPVFREGNQFIIPSGNWSVVEACSGVRYLLASLTVGTLFAYLNYQSTKRRVLFVIVSFLIPIVANWVRAYMIVMLGHLSGNKLAAGVDHLIYGWVFFGVVIMLMFFVGARWAEPDRPGIKKTIQSGTHPDFSPTRLWAVTAFAAMIVALPHIALLAMANGEGGKSVTLVEPKILSPDWQVASEAGYAFKPAFQNPAAEINTVFSSQGNPVGLYLGYYHRQTSGSKLVSSNNALVTSKDPQWARVASGKREIQLNGNAVVVRTAELRGAALASLAADSRLVVWQIYWINGTMTTSDYLAKVYSAFYRLTGRGDESAAIIVYTPKKLTGSTDAVLESFLNANGGAIDALLQKARQSGQ